MLVCFRVDASYLIGTGHVTRCLALAKALYVRGATVFFICRPYSGNLFLQIEQAGFPVYQLSLVLLENSLYPAKKLALWKQDLEETIAILSAIDSNSKLDWLILDHYELDVEWEYGMRAMVEQIMVIDDLANRMHDCDILLDQNLVNKQETRYRYLVPENCELLLGPSYALLDPNYAILHNNIRLREGPVKKLLISFGGADIYNLTGRVLEAILQFELSDLITTHVVVGYSNKHIDLLKSQIEGKTNIVLHLDEPTLAPLIQKVDLAIGACGVTTWERLCLALPSIVVTTAHNQRPIAEMLEQLGLVRWLGDKDQVTVQAILKELKNILYAGLDVQWSAHCHALVDGKGVERICGNLMLS